MRPFFVLALFLSAAAQAQTEVRFWHAMSGAPGEALAALVARFNAAQREVHVRAEYKGDYERTLAAALEARRAGEAPHLVQVDDLGSAELVVGHGAGLPLWQAAARAGEQIDARQLLPAVAPYYSDARGRLYALPFNVSTPVLFYNRSAFRAARLDPERPPRTWYEMPAAMEALLDAGLPCAYTTAWPAWVHVENLSVWHGQPYAMHEDGRRGGRTRLVFNTHLVVRHIALLSSWARAGYFTYSGRRLEGERLFARGQCGMLTASSESYGSLAREVAFDLGVAELPHYDDVPGAPRHSQIGGAALWLLADHPPRQALAAVRFLAYLARPEVQAEWHERTGFVPVSRAAYELSRERGFYAQHPGQAIAIRQLLNASGRDLRALWLGELAAIRTLVEEELERVWRGEKTATQALDAAVERGNALLRAFEAAQRARAHSPPAVRPARP